MKVQCLVPIDFDINNCPACGGKNAMKFVAVIQDPLVVEKFLTHLVYPARPPPVALARYKMTELMDSVTYAEA